MSVKNVLENQRAYFAAGHTIPVSNRVAALKKLYRAIDAHQADIAAALKEDLGKSETESYMCEIGLTLSEIRYLARHLRRWAKGKTVPTDLVNFPARSFTAPEPYGCVLVMSPWNYPFMLCIEPLAGAIAAGNCCIVKPSAYAPATSRLLKTLLGEAFAPEYVAVVEGGRAENAELLEQRFDYIFFTGGVGVGKLVMQKAAAHLTPVTLELGGKSPCIITDSCDLKVAAARLVFGKFLNCGQTCVAPDYVLADRKLLSRLIIEIQKQITAMFGENPLQNPDYGKIINRKHFDRLSALIDREKLVCGGTVSPGTLQIAPTVLCGVTGEDPVMQQEIFGPILPIIPYDTLEEAEKFIRSREKPLALYLFTRERAVEERFLRHVPFGGGCVNDTIVHLATSHMPFGGVGSSGMGSYHGKKSFETFSHEKSILKKANWLDLPMRYQPYSKPMLALIRMFLQ